MQAKFSILLSAMLLAVGASGAVERVEKHQWLVGDAPIVKVETFHGSIRVERSESGRVELGLRAQASGQRAENWLNQIEVQASPFGAGLVVQVKQRGWSVEFGSGEASRRELDLVLRVPARCNLDLKSDLGRIEVADDIEGNMRARLSTGDIYFGRVIGSVTAVTRSGDLIIARTSGDLNARSHFGNLHIGTIMGWAELRADHGNIDVANSYGGLSAESVKGDIKAGMSRQITADTRLKASVGDVWVDLDPESALQVAAVSSWGQVHSALDFESAAERTDTQLQGSLNGGGPMLSLEAEGGDVRIKAVSTYGM
jgi:DUF4097 and DUF4098 domain-containing protein YvlB